MKLSLAGLASLAGLLAATVTAASKPPMCSRNCFRESAALTQIDTTACFGDNWEDPECDIASLCRYVGRLRIKGLVTNRPVHRSRNYALKLMGCVPVRCGLWDR